VTEFTLTVPRGGGLVRATIYDIRGRAVRRLLDKPLASGEHRIEFNGRNDAGEALPSGMYLCRFNFRDREEVVKATLVK
jgi:flagellar hook assembly protein FlgD